MVDLENALRSYMYNYFSWTGGRIGSRLDKIAREANEILSKRGLKDPKRDAKIKAYYEEFNLYIQAGKRFKKEYKDEFFGLYEKVLNLFNQYLSSHKKTAYRMMLKRNSYREKINALNKGQFLYDFHFEYLIRSIMFLKSKYHRSKRDEIEHYLKRAQDFHLYYKKLVIAFKQKQKEKNNS